MTDFDMFKGNIEPQKDHNIEIWQARRQLELKHKNDTQFSVRIKISLTFQLSIVM